WPFGLARSPPAPRVPARRCCVMTTRPSECPSRAGSWPSTPLSAVPTCSRPAEAAPRASDSRSEPRPTAVNRGLRLYLVGIAVPAAAVLGAVLGLPRTPSDPVLAAVLVSIGALAANFPVMIRKNYKVDATPAVDLALVVLFPAATAVALVGLGRFLGDGTLCLRRNPNTGKGRRRPIDLLFNTSQMILAAAAAAIIYHGVLTTGTLADGAGALVAAIAAAAAMYVTTTTLVVIAVAMMS